MTETIEQLGCDVVCGKAITTVCVNGLHETRIIDGSGKTIHAAIWSSRTEALAGHAILRSQVLSEPYVIYQHA